MNEIINVSQSTMLEALNRSEVDMQIATAKAYPRDVKKSLERIKAMAKADEETANGCFYHLSRGGDEINGLSVRMAEIIASCWGNLRVQSRIIGNDGRTITAQGVCHDLESNLAVSVEVKRKITGKNGQTFSEDMQVVTGNAACAIAFRNAVLKVVPKAITQGVINEVQEGAKKNIDLAKNRQQCVGYFVSLGVAETQLFEFLGINTMEEITADMIMNLRGIATAIKEGTTTVQETFVKPADEKAAAAKAKEKAEDAKKRAEAAINRSTNKVLTPEAQTAQNENSK
jgi:hypothetical protein